MRGLPQARNDAMPAPAAVPCAMHENVSGHRLILNHDEVAGEAMRAAVYHGTRDLRLESVPEPQAGPGDVKLRVLYNGICGSDLHEYYDGPVTTRTTPHPLTGVQNHVILGHELCGEVVSCGADVEDMAIGDLVAVDPLESCGGCLWCLAGQYNHCPLVALR